MRTLNFKQFNEAIKIDINYKTFIILALTENNINNNLVDISKISKNFLNETKNIIRNIPKSLNDLFKELFSENGYAEDQEFIYVENKDLMMLDKNLQTSANIVFSTKYNILENVKDNKLIDESIKRIFTGIKKGSKNLICNVLLFSTENKSNAIEIYMNNKWQKNDNLRKLYLGK